MGVDYESVFGFGVEVDEVTFKDIKEEEYKQEYLDKILHDTDYSYIYSGDYGYSDEPYTYYIILRNTLFDVDYNVNKEVEEFELFLKDKGIKFKGKTNVVGCLCIN